MRNHNEKINDIKISVNTINYINNYDCFFLSGEYRYTEKGNAISHFTTKLMNELKELKDLDDEVIEILCQIQNPIAEICFEDVQDVSIVKLISETVCFDDFKKIMKRFLNQIDLEDINIANNLYRLWDAAASKYPEYYYYMLEHINNDSFKQINFSFWQSGFDYKIIDVNSFVKQDLEGFVQLLTEAITTPIHPINELYVALPNLLDEKHYDVINNFMTKEKRYIQLHSLKTFIESMLRSRSSKKFLDFIFTFVVNNIQIFHRPKSKNDEKPMSLYKNYENNVISCNSLSILNDLFEGESNVYNSFCYSFLDDSKKIELKYIDNLRNDDFIKINTLKLNDYLFFCDFKIEEFSIYLNTYKGVVFTADGYLTLKIKNDIIDNVFHSQDRELLLTIDERYNEISEYYSILNFLQNNKRYEVKHIRSALIKNILSIFKNEKNKVKAFNELNKGAFLDVKDCETASFGNLHSEMSKLMTRDEIISCLGDDNPFIAHAAMYREFCDAVIEKDPHIYKHLNLERGFDLFTVGSDILGHFHQSSSNYHFICDFYIYWIDFFHQSMDTMIREDKSDQSFRKTIINNLFFGSNFSVIEKIVNMELKESKNKKVMTLKNLDRLLGGIFFCFGYESYEFFINYIVKNYTIEMKETKPIFNFKNIWGIVDFKEKMEKLKDLDALMPDNKSIYDVLEFELPFGCENNEFESIISPFNLTKNDIVHISDYPVDLKDVMTVINNIYMIHLDNEEYTELNYETKALLDFKCSV